MGKVLVVGRDCLNRDPTAAAQALGDPFEIDRPVGLADRLDHLDRHDVVERTFDVAVIA